MKNTPVQLHAPVEDFSFSATSNIQRKLSDFSGKYVILYFYPKDSTPGCTRESTRFKELCSDFTALNSCIFGVSKDSLKSHEKFKASLELPFELISDEDEKLCDLFGVHKKSALLEKLTGIERSTFIIGPDRSLVSEWRSVKVTGHVEEVLETLKKMDSL